MIPHPRRQTFSRGAALSTATIETSATTVYCEKVDVPIYLDRPNRIALYPFRDHDVKGDKEAYKMVDSLTLALESRCAIGHDAFALCSANFAA